MDEKALGMKLREINKAACLRVDQKFFDAVEADITSSTSWFNLLMQMEGAGCDKIYVDLAEECVKKCARLSIGDKAE